MDSWNLRLDDLMPVIRERLEAGETVEFMPRGVSMLPLLRQGRDAVVLSPLPERLRKYDVVLYRRRNGQYVLHRIVECGETYTCMGDNQFAREPGLRREQMIAVMTAYRRDGKLRSVTATGYRVYVRLWHWTRPLRRIMRKIKGQT